ncbi:MAG TPA: PP2C family protein-serine/threonine phosphatase [Mycobacteriales bacterium]|nr:PP2C family protein-serine/threonine phosphatase [Mycobacteriales bacterium]
MAPVALIVPDPEAADASAAELCAVLQAEDAEVRWATAAQIIGREHADRPPEILFVHARLTGAEVAQLAAAFEDADRPPTIVVFSGRDQSLLQQHLGSRYDYLLPPYPPWLLRSRLHAGRRAAGELTDISEIHQLLRYERELQIGREIQQGFLPGLLPSPDGWELAAHFRPARVVAGDFYDAFELIDGRRIAFIVADVCDKGVGAALFMALIRTLLRHTAQHSGAGPNLVSDVETAFRAEDAGGQDPLRSRAMPTVGAGPLIGAVRGTNEYMTRNHLAQGYFATLFFAMLDPRTGGLIYINGGHTPPVLLHADGSLEPLVPTGPAVGLMPESVFKIEYASVHAGETLFAFTDGVTEAKNERGEFFSEARLFDLLRHPVSSVGELLDRVDRAIREFAGPAEQFDDVTMLAVRHLPADQPGPDPDRTPAAPAQRSTEER